MQLLGAPDRLQENSIYLHTIYQLSSIDGLILRHRLPAVHLPVSVMSHCCMELYKAPLSSVTSFCRLGVSRGAFQLPRLFPKFWSLPMKAHTSLCLFHKKTRPICRPRQVLNNFDVFLYHLSLCFMLPLTMRMLVKAEWCPLESEDLTGTCWTLCLTETKELEDFNGSVIWKKHPKYLFLGHWYKTEVA